MAQSPHGLNIPFPVVDGCLMVGGVALTEIAARFPETPFYVYDSELVSQRVTQLRQLLPGEIELHYAVKANPMPELLQLMAPMVDGFDVASGGELRAVLETPMAPSEVSFAGPAKKASELELAIEAGIVINLESERELEEAARLSSTLGTVAQVAVRVNPDFELKASGMKMGGRPTQFGIDAERVPGVLKRIGELGLKFVGFHVFSGSQNLRPESIIESQALTFDLAIRLAESAPGPVRLLNIGGGFGIPYFPGEQPLDLAPICRGLEQRLPDVRRNLPEAKVVIELGRYLVGEAGLYVCRVLDRKISKGATFLITDGGLHHHLAASGNFGQVIRKNYPVVVGNRMDVESKETVSVVGPLCTPLDTLAERMELPVAEVGDLVVVLQSGAYGRTASPIDFLSHPPPAEILV